MNIRYRPERKSWVFDVYEDGKRRQVVSKTKREAEARRAELLTERKEFGRRAERLRPEERLELLMLRDRLNAVGATMEEAVSFFLAHRPCAGDRVTFGQAMKELLEEKAAKCDAGTVRTYRNVWTPFARAGFGERMLDEISAKDISNWLQGNGWSAKTQESYRRNLSVLWIWAMSSGRGYTKDNAAAVAGIERDEIEGDVRRLTVAECAEYLRRAAMTDEEFVPFVVLSLFAGLRQAELADSRLDSASGNPPVKVLDDLSQVIVQGAKRRSRRRRLVTLPECARAWLRRWPAAGAPIRPEVNFRDRWEAVRPAQYPKNAARHTFAWHTSWMSGGCSTRWGTSRHS